jgi:hypothetical protein
MRFRFIFSWLWDFLKPTIVLLLTTTGKVLLESASSAVIQAEAMPNVSGPEKHAIAKGIIERDLKSAGYVIGAQVSISLIHTAIELMVDKLAD